MNFEGKTAEKVAHEIFVSAWKDEIQQLIEAACQHFYERGISDAVGSARTFQGDVRQFMEAFGQHMPPTPQWPDQATMDLRVRLESEEYVERMEALGYGASVFINRLDPKEMVQAIFRAVVPPQTARKDFAEAADGEIGRAHV